MAVEIVVTDRIRNTIEEALDKEDIPSALRKKLLSHKERMQNGIEEAEINDKKELVAFSLLRELWEFLRQSKSPGEAPIYLHELMEGIEVYAEPLKEIERSPELISRLKRLKDEQDQKAYNKMVKNVDSKWKYEASHQMGIEVRSTSKELTTIINFLLSIIGTFVFGYFASQYAFPAIEMRIIIGIILAILVAMAELYFMARAEI